MLDPPMLFSRDQIIDARTAPSRSVRVGLIGAGFMGRGIALQIASFTQNMQLAAIANRTLSKAEEAAARSGSSFSFVDAEADFDRVVQAGDTAIVSDPGLITRSPLVDVVVEATGSLEFAAKIVVDAIDHGKHVVLMNAELDATVGPALQKRAERAGVVYSNADGDQPGVIMNLVRFTQQIGLTPVLCGSIKGLLDRYRTPDTQAAFAEKWNQDRRMVTSFADGTKLAFEMAVVANATNSRLLESGMMGPRVPEGTRIEDAVSAFPVDAVIARGGAVDYVVGADPGPGVFVLATCDHPVQREYLNLYKLGSGPLYCLHRPFHLCHFEVPMTIARAALLHEATIRPSGGAAVEVVAMAKRDLAAGTKLDGIGGFDLYGIAEDADRTGDLGLLPMGLAADAVLRRPLRKDAAVRVEDVELKPNRLIDILRAEQDRLNMTARTAIWERRA